MRRRALLLTLLSSLVACTAASTPDEDHEVANDNLTGGTVATDGQFPATLYIRNNCTASKVGPRHVLTAAHCVVANDGSINAI